MCRPVFVTLTVAVVLGVAACSAAPATPAPTSAASPVHATARPHAASPSAAPGRRPCELINAGIAAEYIGAPVFEPREGDHGDGTTCLFAANDGGAGTVGVTIGSAPAGPSALDDMRRRMPDATAAPGLDGVVVATGAAWFVMDRRLVSVVLVDAAGRPAGPAIMAELVRAILTRA